MKKKEETAQLNKLCKKIKVNLKAFLQSENQEELHQFRVQVKKLKAALTLFASEKGNKNLLKYFKPVKKVFAKAGDIRNAHINLKLGEEHQLQESFHQQQQQLLDNHLSDFKKNGKPYLKLIKKAKINFQNHTQQLHNKTVLKFYQDKLAVIEQFFANPAFDEELHTTRKNIKLLIYNQVNAAAAIKDKLQLNLTYLDELQDNIGQWHDHVLTIELLEKTGNAEDATVKKLKNLNSDLEKTIVDLSSNFGRKVMASPEVTVKNEIEK